MSDDDDTVAQDDDQDMGQDIVQMVTTALCAAARAHAPRGTTEVVITEAAVDGDTLVITLDGGCVVRYRPMAVRAAPPEHALRVHAAIHTDDDRMNLERVDVTTYFAEASDDQIAALIACGLGGDYAADDVARHVEDLDDDVALLFRYVELTKEGFEVYVNPDEALLYLARYHPRFVALAHDGTPLGFADRA
jgi:hypothetical protein